MTAAPVPLGGAGDDEPLALLGADAPPVARGDGRADVEACGAIVRRHARTFWFASWLLPPEKRRAANALYAFCRLADDLVDQARVTGTASIARQLADYERRLDATLAGRPEGPVFRELHRVLLAHDVPEAVLRELLDGVARDLRPVHYATWADLVRYCEGVASSVGEMCTYVFGVQGGAETRMRALRYARTLGVAMQLTNILRDVGEDARRGRCYLPAEDLAAFGLSAAEVLGSTALARDERWRPFMAYQVGRARALYAAAEPGLALLAPDAQRCAAACASGYAGILGAIERQGYDTITARAHLGVARRAGVLYEAWRWRAPATGEVIPGEGPHLAWCVAVPTYAPGAPQTPALARGVDGRAAAEGRAPERVRLA